MGNSLPALIYQIVLVYPSHCTRDPSHRPAQWNRCPYHSRHPRWTRHWAPLCLRYTPPIRCRPRMTWSSGWTTPLSYSIHSKCRQQPMNSFYLDDDWLLNLFKTPSSFFLYMWRVNFLFRYTELFLSMFFCSNIEHLMSKIHLYCEKHKKTLDYILIFFHNQ